MPPQNMPLWCIILSYRHLKNRKCRKQFSLNSPSICLNIHPPKGTQMSEIPSLGDSTGEVVDLYHRTRDGYHIQTNLVTNTIPTPHLFFQGPVIFPKSHSLFPRHLRPLSLLRYLSLNFKATSELLSYLWVSPKYT